VLIIEIDGGVHDKKFADTEERNEEYIMARLPLLTINKLEIETTIFDLVDKKVREYLDDI
jgi:very-short-patch-repair endonuclease